MGIDCEFRTEHVSDLPALLAIPDVHQVYPPGQGGCIGHKYLWVITTCVRWVGGGYSSPGRGERVAALVESLRPLCSELWYGGDNAVPFVQVTDELIAQIRSR